MSHFPTIQTRSGACIDLQNPDMTLFCIEDIAWALSNLCRFNGHTKAFYSVAQHSVLVSKVIPQAFALEGLLHDAAEAYLGDVTSPLKDLLPAYRGLEAMFEDRLRAVFCRGREWPTPVVKEADLWAFKLEQNILMNHASRVFEEVALTGVVLTPWTPEYAYQKFLARYNQILTQITEE